MKIIVTILIIIALSACSKKERTTPVETINWADRSIQLTQSDSLLRGSTYLPVYSEIYQRSEGLTYNLTATISIRNISSTDSVFILRADYFNTKGDLIRNHFNEPVFVRPLETIEIVIDEGDVTGGTGANFIFDWAIRNNVHEPFFEAVMISTTGQQGLSFTTRGIKR